MDYPKKAVALKYDKDKDYAPKLVAKGKDYIAERIIEIAKENRVPIYPDRDLVQVLEALDLDFEIPAELYRAVAEVLVFVYDLNRKL
ncbi:MAG: EscU/YscU/HrcU family type III secretion system export apparatus switch protein [Deltaproteobacteria bacterium]|nr:EscU/YscU/HrcU family type III secretion system export apparatus switch protein [Deltaproteobacteria bacterium]